MAITVTKSKLGAEDVYSDSTTHSVATSTGGTRTVYGLEKILCGAARQTVTSTDIPLSSGNIVLFNHSSPTTVATLSSTTNQEGIYFFRNGSVNAVIIAAGILNHAATITLAQHDAFIAYYDSSKLCVLGVFDAS